ncbi:redoxin family protein [Sphingomonas sp.]|uniref:redoxin family protein n=1 Tax=Sphingomonas sp. TaxID=28214 RepID=UPI0035BC23AD
MRRALIWAPLAVFAAIAILVALGLRHPADRTVRSAMAGQPLPAFALPPLVSGKPGLASTDFARGQPRLLNVFASWCVPCVAEAPQLLALKRMGIPIDAVAIHDTAPAVAQFLSLNGDPYDAIGDDAKSSVQLALGSSGVPETFIVDGRGRIVAQHIGDIRADDVATLAAQVEAAQ